MCKFPKLWGSSLIHGTLTGNLKNGVAHFSGAVKLRGPSLFGKRRSHTVHKNDNSKMISVPKTRRGLENSNRFICLKGQGSKRATNINGAGERMPTLVRAPGRGEGSGEDLKIVR